MKKVFSILLLVLLCSFMVFANGAPEQTQPAEEIPPKPEGTIELVWWTNFGKANVAYLQRTIDAFNASQSDYHLTIEYQGSAGELDAKVASTLKADLPDLVNHAAQRVAEWDGVDYIVPLQEWVDKDKEGWKDLDSLYPALRAAYSDRNGKLIGFPNGYSYGAVYYNADMFKKAGIDPNRLVSMEGIVDVAKELVDGGYCTYGIGFHPSGYYANVNCAREGVNIYDNRNGYDGTVTKCLFLDGGAAQEAVVKLITAYKKLYNGNYAVPYGANYTTEVLPKFGTGECAMYYGVVSTTTKVLSAVNGGFEIGVMPAPSVTANGARAGECNGGTGMFMCDTGDYWRMKGAYEFIKFQSQAQYMADFAASTGYLAPSDDAYNSEIIQEYLKQIPAMSAVYDSLKASTGEANLPYCGVVTVTESVMKTAIQTVANDPNADVLEVIKVARDEVQDAIDMYNLAN